MSRIEPKAGEWLRQQIEELGALRNASVRDPQFKAWRQNTLTYIQRIWAGDTSKSERFRRIPFSPASTRVDARQVREQFERGCGEALEYLNSLRVTLGEERVAPGTTRSVPLATEPDEPMEGDFPVLQLGADLAPKPADSASDLVPPRLPEGMMGEEAELDLPGSAPSAPAPRSTGPSRLPTSAMHSIQPEGLPEDFTGATPLDGPRAEPQETPLPPAAESRISVRGPAAPKPSESNEPRFNPLKDIFASHRKQEQGSGRSGKAGRGRKGAKARLKDMLGLASLESTSAGPPAPTPVAASAEPAPAASEPIVPPAPTFEPTEPVATSAFDREPAPTAAPTAARPTTSDLEHWTMPEFMTPEESVVPLTAEDVEPAHPAVTDAPPAELWRDRPEASEAWHDVPSAFASASVESSEEAPDESAETAPAEVAARGDLPANADPDEMEPADDATDRARVTAEFLKNSPVLSSLPRAVQRRGQPAATAKAQAIPARDSAASLMLAIAAEVDALGVPEGHRARARAALMDLARQLDQPEVSWDVLRDAVQFVMEFPPVARRALPLLLPFLDIAA